MLPCQVLSLSPSITTLTGRIGALGYRAPCLDLWFATDRSPGERYWEASTMSTPVLVELGSPFAPSAAEPALTANSSVRDRPRLAGRGRFHGPKSADHELALHPVMD